MRSIYIVWHRTWVLTVFFFSRISKPESSYENCPPEFQVMSVSRSPKNIVNGERRPMFEVGKEAEFLFLVSCSSWSSLQHRLSDSFRALLFFFLLWLTWLKCKLHCCMSNSTPKLYCGCFIASSLVSYQFFLGPYNFSVTNTQRHHTFSFSSSSIHFCIS